MYAMPIYSSMIHYRLPTLAFLNENIWVLNVIEYYWNLFIGCATDVRNSILYLRNTISLPACQSASLLTSQQANRGFSYAPHISLLILAEVH